MAKIASKIFPLGGTGKNGEIFTLMKISHYMVRDNHNSYFLLYLSIGFLLVRVKKGQQDLYIMHVQVPLLCTTQTIDWIGIADHEVNYNHIRCLQLSSESKISDIVEQLEETGLVKCLVLISHKSYHLDQSSFFHHRCNFPILVAKFNGGAMLLELLKQFGRKVDAKVELFFAEKRDLRQITESKEEKSGI